MLAALESCQRLGFVTFYPTGLIQRYRLPTALRAIFMQQTVLYYFKLQLTDRAYYLAAIKLVYKQLSHTFIHKLLDTFFELL